MAGIKCKNCGGTDLVPFRLDDGREILLDGSHSPNFEPYVCLNCRHIEIFATEQAVNKIISQNQKNKEIEEKVAVLKAELESKEKELEALKAIANDDEQSVRAVREAKGKIVQTEQEIENLKSKISAVKSKKSDRFSPYSSSISQW